MAELWKNPEVLNAVYPVFPISRILGVIPYSSTFGLSNRWLVYSILFHALLLILSVYQKVASLSSVPKYDIYSFLNDFQIVLNYIIVLIQVARITIKRSALASILKKFLEIDSYWVTYSKTYGRFYYILGLLWIWVPPCAFVLFDGDVPAPEKYSLLTLQFVVTISYSVAIVICSLLEMLRCHLTSLTEQLKPQKLTLFALIETHDIIVRLASAINDFFSWQILWICIRCSVTFVLDIFMLLKVVSSSPIGDSYIQFVLATTRIFWDFLVLFLLSASCSRTSEEVDVFNSQLFKVVRSHSSLYKNEKLKMYTIIQENHEFKACGYFTVGYPLLTSVIGATTTYVVILVQFLFDSGSSSSPSGVAMSSPNISSESSTESS